MKKYFTIILAAVLLAGCASSESTAQSMRRKTVKASDNYVTKDVKASAAFTSVKMNGVADLVYTQTRGRAKIVVSGSDNVLPYLKVKVSGGVLEIGMERNVQIRGDHRLKVEVWGPGVNDIVTNGTGSVKFPGGLDVSDIKITTNGTGGVGFKDITARDVTLRTNGTGSIRTGDIECTTFKVVSNGTGNFTADNIESVQAEIGIGGTGSVKVAKARVQGMEIRTSGTGGVKILDGTAESLTVRVSGTGSVDTRMLRADRVDARLSGTGSLHCHAVKRLEANVSGTGNIDYSGNPAYIDITGRNQRIRKTE